MSIDSPPRLMTVDELLDLPERKFVERTLIQGQLRERKVTYRNPWHSSALAKVSFFLEQWRRAQSLVRCTVVAGDAGFLLRHDPDSVAGIDVAIAHEGTPLYRRGKKVIYDGPPLLAVEIRSPSDRDDDVETKVDEYLAAGVPLVWVISPRRRTVTVIRPDAEPELFSESEEMSGEPHLPGLRFKVAELFADIP
jgi:Uma2 family endonuclease